jgi:hypothetical protein
MLFARGIIGENDVMTTYAFAISTVMDSLFAMISANVVHAEADK